MKMLSKKPLLRPLPPAPAVPIDEIKRRRLAVMEEMARSNIDVIVLTDHQNIQYLTDYQSLSWTYNARPVLAAISTADLQLFGSLAEARTVEARERSFTAHYYDGYLPEAVDVIAGWIKQAGPGLRRIAVDYGSDSRGLGSLELIDALADLSLDGRVVSACDVLWNVRLIKSRFEAEMKRISFDIVNRAFDTVIASAYIGIPEYELCQKLQAQIYLNGAETAAPIAMLFSKGDFAYGRPPSERMLVEGHYIWTDFRSTYGGYPADRNRIARAGMPSSWEVETYDKVRRLTIGLASSVKPGMSCAELYTRFERMWRDADLGARYSKVSRIGHGGGLDITEPPSISPVDNTEIRPGMILHLEPKLERDGAVFQFEEVVYVTEDGCEFLSELSPETIPVVS
ncbi:aminopeptidase P family protein [Mesorhizobium camelthorni]|uniref:Aminopeptidase P family protein n=2 Tax=Allomesorhizobium camelthorni TaxID=475069 RepID=A0A6G4WGF9_9HYPH|nr:aminopeptidase P family protein [Mesorhizobium camelthorni]